MADGNQNQGATGAGGPGAELPDQTRSKRQLMDLPTEIRQEILLLAADDYDCRLCHVSKQIAREMTWVRKQIPIRTPMGVDECAEFVKSRWPPLTRVVLELYPPGKVVWDYANGFTEHRRRWLAVLTQLPLSVTTVRLTAVDAWAYDDMINGTLDSSQLLVGWIQMWAAGRRNCRVLLPKSRVPTT